MFEPRFVYHASGAGVGARIIRIDPPGTKPTRNPQPNVDHNIPVQAASCLPVTGGLSESTTGPFAYKVDKPRALTLLSVQNAHTRTVTNLPPGPPFTIRTEVRINDVKLIDRIAVRHIYAQLLTQHDGKSEFPHVTPECAILEGLLLDGYPIRVTLEKDIYRRYPTKKALKENFKDLVGEYGPQLGVKPGQRAQTLPETNNGISECTIVKDIDLGKNPPRGARRTAVNQITWDGVGRIYLGELLITDDYRRLTMVRVELGSEIEGRAAFADVQSNSGPLQ